MIDERIKLTVLHDDNTVFSDHTNASADYIRDTFSLDLSSTEDYLYIGFRKPMANIYIELEAPNTTANDLSAEVWDGTAWVAASLNDETKGLTRSGFISWDKGDMNETTVNSTDKYWIRMRPSADHTATTVRGINLVFSDDNSLKQEFFEIDNSNILPAGETSHISKHVASKNHIIQRLRNLKYIKVNSTTGNETLDQWDLHDIYEIKEASKFLTLSKIFFNLSDSVEDNWWQKHVLYQQKFEQMFDLAKLSLDTDDDGVEDSDEKLQAKTPQRWSR